jgi:uncharacterized phage-associated protein
MNTKNLQLLGYLAKKHQGASVTVLIKLCYLADLVSIKNGGQKISTFNYVRYFYGPFDPEIYQNLETLLSDGTLISKPEYTAGGAETIVYKFNEERDLATSSLSPEEISVLDELLETVSGYGAKALTEVAYNTAPMKAFNATLGGQEHLNELLDLELVRA